MFEVHQTTAGEWTVVASAGRALLVAVADRAALLRYHAAVRTGFAETLDALVADGLSRAPEFGLLDTSGPATLLAVRGGVRAAVSEHRPDGDADREVRASTVSSWLETQLEGAVTVGLGGWEGETLPLGDGIVRATGLTWTAADDAAHDPVPPEVGSTRMRITEPLSSELLDEALSSTVAAEVGPAPAPEPVSAVDAPTRVPESTIAESTIAEAPERDQLDAEQPEAGMPEPEPELPGYDHLFGATMMRGIEEAAVRPEAPDEGEEGGRIDLPGFITDSFSSPSAAGDHDGLTVFSGDLPSRPPIESLDAAPMAAIEDEPLRYRLVLGDGRQEELAGAVIVGRAPSASAYPALRGARPVTLTGAEDDISRSHVAIALEGDSVVVTDLHSRNGTVILLPGKSPQKLRAGEPTTVVAGTVVDLGSGATLTVEAGA